MRAIRVHEVGGPDVLSVDDLDDPAPGPDEVVVDVAAAGVNFIDTYHRSGAYPRSTPFGLGQEGAGTIVAVGSEVTQRRVGERVAWSGHAGSYAELVAVAADVTVPVPDDLDLEVATALMLQGMTAHYLSHSTVRLGRDDTVVVYAAAGGVGRLLVQLAKRRGARVLACTSTPQKQAAVRALGADEVIAYRDVDVPATVAELTAGHGADVVYDSVGRDTFDDSLASLRPRGTLVLYGQSSGAVPPVDLQRLAQSGSLYVTRPVLAHYVATPDELNWRATALFDLARTDQLDVAIHDRYRLADARQAHSDLESGTTSGKLLLIP